MKEKLPTKKKSIEEQKTQSQEIEKQKNPSWYQKGVAGKIIGGLAGVGAKIVDKVREAGHKVSDFMEAKLGPKWGRIAGAVVGVVAGVMVAGAIVAATALTGGVGLAATAGIYAGCALAMGAVGTGVGHVVGKKVGVGTLITAGVGMQAGIPPVTALAAGVGLEVVSEKLTGKNIGEHMNSAGVAAGIIASAALTGGMSLPVLLAGATAGKGVDLAVEKLTGKTIGQLGDKALETVSAKLTEAAQSCAIDPRAKEWLVEQTKCQAVSQERLKEIEKSIGSPDRTQDHSLANNLAKQQEREVKPLEQALNEAKEKKQQQTKIVSETQQDVSANVKVEQQKDVKLPSLQESVSQIKSNIKTQEPKLLEDKSKEPVSSKKPLQQSGGSRTM
ncbi:hypothetical protein Trichorick_00708 [Candidatus Trichorickettsia mobilis]|uniref:Uncharacterized protein n=1 Tax=Candidatus Trichorickettsia mobilis TaxID=1346319 RepID=A0ABZ0UUE3_9RICK|nr:hypothetical protein [Candidatus Trichorickettsia mobilis]WPY00820.1 hypothetical protein Trichorick_00708 [Candidatus Trichorickettsia mobilis]